MYPMICIVDFPYKLGGVFLQINVSCHSNKIHDSRKEYQTLNDNHDCEKVMYSWFLYRQKPVMVGTDKYF